MKLTVKSKVELKDLSKSAWEDIFIEAIETTNDLLEVVLITFEHGTCIPQVDTSGDHAIEEIMHCIAYESKDREIYSVELTLNLEENFYDEKDNLLHSEVEYFGVDEFGSSDLDVKFYYEAGNFLLSKEEKKRYTKVYSAH